MIVGIHKYKCMASKMHLNKQLYDIIYLKFCPQTIDRKLLTLNPFKWPAYTLKLNLSNFNDFLNCITACLTTTMKLLPTIGFMAFVLCKCKLHINQHEPFQFLWRLPLSPVSWLPCDHCSRKHINDITVLCVLQHSWKCFKGQIFDECIPISNFSWKSFKVQELPPINSRYTIDAFTLDIFYIPYFVW